MWAKKFRSVYTVYVCMNIKVGLTTRYTRKLANKYMYIFVSLSDTILFFLMTEGAAEWLNVAAVITRHWNYLFILLIVLVWLFRYSHLLNINEFHAERSCCQSQPIVFYLILLVTLTTVLCVNFDVFLLRLLLLYSLLSVSGFSYTS